MHHLEIEEQERRYAAIERRAERIQAERAEAAMAEMRRREPVIQPAVDWSKAPQWANYWAMDDDGVAFWHSGRPRIDRDDGEWRSSGRAKQAPEFDWEAEDWDASLVEHGRHERVKAEAAIKDRFTTDDTVDHPAHYTQGGIECIEVLEQLAADGHDFRILNAIKYLWRYQHKGGDESLRKAIWYIERTMDYP